MTQQQTAQLERAAQIAARDALTAHKGTTHDGRAVWAVLNRSASAKAGYPVYHLVTVEAGQLVCDCYASQHGRICAHRAATRAAIEAALKASAKAATTASPALRWSRETAPLYRSNAPVGIFK
ncbi:MAG: hypothetical protein IVW57_09170 [Ktedonobacterales bacterium]|nr:hypothetical protein [Ktedonobacterales bacterium]